MNKPRFPTGKVILEGGITCGHCKICGSSLIPEFEWFKMIPKCIHKKCPSNNRKPNITQVKI